MNINIKPETVQRVILLVVIFMIPLFYFFGILSVDTNPFVRIAFMLASSCAWIFIFEEKKWRRNQGFEKLFMIMGLQTLFLYIFQQIHFINDYPLSQSWSETSHYYYASTFFAERIYGKSLMLPYIKQSMYMVLSLPFLIPDVNLFSLRLWERTLVIIIPILTSYFIIRRVSFSRRTNKYIFFIWCTLFLLQGPIYYHLLFIPIIFFILYRSGKVLRTSILVFFLSVWTGLSRINWYPVPGTLAALMFYLKVERDGRSFKSVAKYHTLPAFWLVLSMGTSFLSMYFYQGVSNVDPRLLGSALYSKLLWYRLFPNPTFKPGILIGSLAVSGVVLFFIGKNLKKRNWSNSRKIAIVGIIAVFLLGGLIVSVKIGGGADLHNMDIYLMLIAVLFIFLYFGKEKAGKEIDFLLQTRYKHLWIFLLYVPVIYISANVPPLPELDYQTAADTIQTMQEEVNFYNDQGEDVLLATQHHLYTFDIISDVIQDPFYEKTLMMEVAISENKSLIQKYRNDMEEGKYPVIISDALFPGHKNRYESSFAEEQYYYAEYIADTIRKHYQEVMNLPGNIYIFESK